MKKLFFLLLLLLCACSDTTHPLLKNGIYEYQGYGNSGNLLAIGTLSLTIDDTSIVGTKNIAATSDSIAIEAGNGNIDGAILTFTMPDNLIQIILTRNSDGEFFITGHESGDTIYGSRVFFPDSITEVSGDIGTFKLWFQD